MSYSYIVPSVPQNLKWMAQWEAMSLANMQNSDNVNARLTIKNRPKSGGGFENILEWEKFSILIENISTANPLTDTPLYSMRNNYVGSQKHHAEIDVFLNESKTFDSKLYTAYHDATTNEMEIVKKIYIADGDVLNKEYEKYLFTYNKTNHIFDYQTYTNSMSTVIYNGASLTVKSPIFYFDPVNSDGYFKVKTTQGHCYFESPVIDQSYSDSGNTMLRIRNEATSDNVLTMQQKTLISDFNYIFTQSKQTDKTTMEMKVNMSKGAPTIPVTTTTPIKYELERNGSGFTTTDLLTFASQAQFNNGILNNLTVKKPGVPILAVQTQTASGNDKNCTLRLANDEGEIDQNLCYFTANDSIEYNMLARMGRSSVNTYKTPLKYELQRNGSQVVTKNMFTYSADVTMTGNFLPPIKDYACARTGNTPLTEDLGVSTTWSYMPTLIPPNIDKTTNFANCFGSTDGYGFKYIGTRGLRAHVCVSITFFSSITTNVQWLLSHMYGAGAGYDVQCSNTLPSATSPFGACSLNGIVLLSNNDIVRLIVSKTSGSSGTVSFLCNFSIVPIDYTS